MKANGQSGFANIILIVAIAAVLVLMGYYFAARNNFQTTPQQKSLNVDSTALIPDRMAIENAKSIVHALETYRDRSGRYPGTLFNLVNEKGEIEETTNGSILFASDQIRRDFFKNISYKPSEDFQHYLLMVALTWTKDSHGFAKSGQFAPPNYTLYGVDCSDSRTYCFADPATTSQLASSSDASSTVLHAPATLDVSGWQTYKDTVNGIEFKYPADFSLDASGPKLHPEDTGLYNYSYDIENPHSQNSYGKKEMLHYSNFSLDFSPYGGLPTQGYSEEIRIGELTYYKKKTNAIRRDMTYYLRYPKENKYIVFWYYPTIDSEDFPPFGTEPSSAVIEAMKKNPKYLGEQEQTAILNSILASVKYF